MATTVIDNEQPVSEVTGTPEGSPAPVTPTPDDGMSELQRHKVARGLAKPRTETVIPDVTETPAKPDTARAEPSDEPVPLDAKDRFEDPDTREVLDLRTRNGKRIRNLLGDRARLRAENEELRARNTTRPADEAQPGRTAQPQAPTQTTETDDPEPKLDDFTSYDEYSRATSRWVTRQELKSQRDTERASAQQQARHQQFQQSVEKYSEALPQVRQKYPDYDEVLARIPLDKAHQHITNAVLTSPVGHELAYYLGTHPDAYKAIMTAPTLDAHLRLIGRFEAQVEAAASPAAPSASPRTSRAPEPVAPVHSAGSTQTTAAFDPDDVQAWRQRRGMGRSMNR